MKTPPLDPTDPTGTADDAAKVAKCSVSKIRKRLVPVSVLRRHVRNRGDIVSYLYSLDDAQRLGAGLPLPNREHPDPVVLSKLRKQATAGAALRAFGRQVAALGQTLGISIPANTPACCRRHARNHVRHEGTGYDGVLEDRRDAKGFSSADAGYSELKATMDSRIEAELKLAGRWPDVDDCGSRI